MKYKGDDLIYLAELRGQWLTLVNMVMNRTKSHYETWPFASIMNLLHKWLASRPVHYNPKEPPGIC
jgi:hypothetical protein